MGMFDEVIIDYELPGRPAYAGKDHRFQTKDFGCHLDLYRITEDGRLLYRQVEREWVENESSKIGGHLKIAKEEWIDTEFHGDLNVYTLNDRLPCSGWVEYTIRFTHGAVEWVREEKEIDTGESPEI